MSGHRETTEAEIAAGWEAWTDELRYGLGEWRVDLGPDAEPIEWEPAEDGDGPEEGGPR